MTPSFQPGDLLWLDRQREGKLERGDVVAAAFPLETDWVLKRIVGLPGEAVEVRQSRVWVNSQALPEPYVHPRSYLEPKKDAAWQLGPFQYAVLGDARDDSADSRQWGPVTARDIKGIVRWRWWPLSRLGRFSRHKV